MATDPSTYIQSCCVQVELDGGQVAIVNASGEECLPAVRQGFENPIRNSSEKGLAG